MYGKNNNKRMKALGTAHNRTVYAVPAVAGLVFRSLGHSAPLHSHAHSRYIWAARNPTGFFIVPPKRRKQPERYVPYFSKPMRRIHAAQRMVKPPLESTKYFCIIPIMHVLKELDNRRMARISSVNRLHKEEFAQYLTPIEIASFMAKITTKYCMIKDTLDVLDPGAGSGILSCSSVNELKYKKIKTNINLDAYEIDSSILDELEQSYQGIQKYINW